jgi:hypothetical protein
MPESQQVDSQRTKSEKLFMQENRERSAESKCKDHAGNLCRRPRSKWTADDTGTVFDNLVSFLVFGGHIAVHHQRQSPDIAGTYLVSFAQILKHTRPCGKGLDHR